MSYHIIAARSQAASPAVPLAVPPLAVSKMLSLGLTSVYGLMRSGELRSFRVGRARRIILDSVSDYIERRAVHDGHATSKNEPVKSPARQGANAAA
jgi:excisionase family DNA binding protein